jgi:hypothetical protein
MPKIYKARLTDCGNRRMLDTADVKSIIKPAVKPVIKTISDNMARKTLVSTYFGSEYSSLREVDDLKIFDESNESQPPKLVCVFPGSAFVAENGSNELCVYWVSDDPVATGTLGDRKTGMTAAKFQSRFVLKARELSARGLR